MPPTRAALVVVISAAPDHGEITLKPMPAPNASRSRVKAAATKPPAMIAGHDTAETAGASASTMTVSTMGAPCVCRSNGQLWVKVPRWDRLLPDNDHVGLGQLAAK